MECDGNTLIDINTKVNQCLYSLCRLLSSLSCMSCADGVPVHGDFEEDIFTGSPSAVSVTLSKSCLWRKLVFAMVNVMTQHVILFKMSAQ